MSKAAKKNEHLKHIVQHIDPTAFNAVPLVAAMENMAFQARNLARAAQIYQRMIEDRDCTIILCLAGSLISAGLKRVIVELLANNMVDAVVSTGANIVDQDFFEALGFFHYLGTPDVDDNELRELAIDRIYDTFIDEDELRICDHTIAEIADSLDPKPYSSQEFIKEMGKWLVERDKGKDSVVRVAYEKAVPIFVPAFSDSSAGFGLVFHQRQRPQAHVSLDSAKDFLDLTRIKVHAQNTGLVMVGGGVPKNFAQDIVVAAEILGHDAPMHKYAVQITVADERDGGLSGSTLKEASSWGKVSTSFEQMVFSEATLAFPLLASYVYHKGAWQQRAEKRWGDRLETLAQPLSEAR